MSPRETMVFKFRLALLVCDTPNPYMLDAHGDYLAIFNRYFKSSLYDESVEFVMDGYDVVHKQEYPPDDSQYDAVVITGSAASAYEDIPWINKLVAYVSDIAITKPAVKIIGICFGHQIIALAFGSQCVRNNSGWEAGVYQVQLTDTGKQVFGAPSINIQQMHRDHVPALPPRFKLLGSTEICPVQGMILPYEDDPTRIHVFCVQGHPEFVPDIIHKIVDVRGNTVVMDAETAEEARVRAEKPDDGTGIIGKAIWKVIGV